MNLKTRIILLRHADGNKNFAMGGGEWGGGPIHNTWQYISDLYGVEVLTGEGLATSADLAILSSNQVEIVQVTVKRHCSTRFYAIIVNQIQDSIL